MVKSNLLSLYRRLRLPKRGFKWLMEQVNLPFPGVTFLPSENGRRFPWVNLFFDSLHLKGATLLKHTQLSFHFHSSPPNISGWQFPCQGTQWKRCLRFVSSHWALGELVHIHVDARWRSGEVRRLKVDPQLMLACWCYHPTVCGEMLRRYQFSWWCFHIEPRTKKRSRWCTNLTSPLAEKVVSSYVGSIRVTLFGSSVSKLGPSAKKMQKNRHFSRKLKKRNVSLPTIFVPINYPTKKNSKQFGFCRLDLNVVHKVGCHIVHHKLHICTNPQMWINETCHKTGMSFCTNKVSFSWRGGGTPFTFYALKDAGLLEFPLF